jgi:hypothetical protein
METTLTMENLLAIFQAMDRIKPIDRSDYFNNYYQGSSQQITGTGKCKEWIEEQVEADRSGKGILKTTGGVG